MRVFGASKDNMARNETKDMARSKDMARNERYGALERYGAKRKIRRARRR